ncbi:MAG: hypothetical protein II649_07495 [Kiritimatiellae bacterium]|nr:hypothetical protein [Kiritimatiellia bacterium]
MVEIPSLSIESVFGCIPPDEVDNLSALARLVGAAKAESIVKATGFATRRVAAPGVDVFDLALPAARRALEGVRPEDVGGVVSVTFSHRDRFPALAVRLQNALGLQHDIAAFDIGLACSGYPYGLFIAGQLASATGKKVLLVDGDVQSAHVDASDANTLAVMGDGATATIVSAQGGSAKFAFYTDGAGADVLRCREDGTIRMDGFGVFRFVAGPVTGFLREFLAQAGKPDLFAPHLANMYMIRQLAKTLELQDRLVSTNGLYANTGSCSVPLALASAALPPANGKALRIIAAGFGAGLSASAANVELSSTLKRGMVEP